MKTRKTTESGAPSPNMYIDALRRQKVAFLVVFLFSGLVNILMLTGSVYMLQVYDRVLSSGSIPTLVGLFAIVVALYIFFGLFDFLRQRLLSRIALRLDASFGAKTFDAWIKSGLNSTQPGGQNVPQPIRQLGLLRQFISSPTATSLFDLPFVPIFLGAMFLIHFWLGVMVVAGALVAGAVALLGRFLTKKQINDSMAHEGALHAFSEQSHVNAETIIAMGMQSNVTKRWHDMQLSSLATHQSISNPSEALASVSKTFRLLLQSAILTVGAFLVLQNQISAGMIIASSILSGRALAPIDQIIGQWRSIGRAVSAHRILRDFFSEQSTSPSYADLPAPTGRITLSGITKFAMGAKGKPSATLLSNVQFELEPGDGLGVVGKSGSGKSTLARVLVGAWIADRGELRLDGATMDQWDPAVLGQSIGYLPQKVDLLPGSISANIARFTPGAKDADVIAAAKLTGVHDMILKLPEGYATLVGGPGGTTLSGGQIQRLGLARAAYCLPRIVVLDEPNSNLDTEGDDALGQAIKGLREAGTTVIVMAHRPSAIAAVNKIMILHEGRVARLDTKENIMGGSKDTLSVTPEETRQAPAPELLHDIPQTTQQAAPKAPPKRMSKATDVVPAQGLPKVAEVPGSQTLSTEGPVRSTPKPEAASHTSKLALILQAERARENQDSTTQQASG
jgi:ATP-binding cassette subfamily C protein